MTTCLPGKTRLPGRAGRFLPGCHLHGLLPVLVLVLLSLAPRAGAAAEATIAVAANFAPAARHLARLYEAVSGDRLLLATGSTGQLFAQIRQGAPYDALLAADRARPARLHEEGEGAASPFTYATGRLALWSVEPDLVPADGRELLAADGLSRIALANPRVAPYGLAARETLEALGHWTRYQGRIVMGQSIAQTFQITAVRGAPAGFVALAQIRGAPAHLHGSHWLVPERLHAPIHQDAVLLRRGAENRAARGFLDFLSRPASCNAIRDAGYRPGPACP